VERMDHVSSFQSDGEIGSIYFEQPERMLATYSAINSNVPAAVIQLNQSLLRAALSNSQVEWEQFEKTGKDLQDFFRTQKIRRARRPRRSLSGLFLLLPSRFLARTNWPGP